MKKILILLNLIAGFILLRFTVSKFAAWPISVAGFIDMAQPLGVDPTALRITTGFIIGYAMLAFFTNCFIIFFKKENNRNYVLLLGFNIFYALGAMIGALLTEFYIRSSVKWLLVYLAIGVIVVAISNFIAYKSQLSKAFLSLKKTKG